jgi:hypothetical protein
MSDQKSCLEVTFKQPVEAVVSSPVYSREIPIVWEYSTVRAYRQSQPFPGDPPFTEFELYALQEAGKHGWEMVCLVDVGRERHFLLKRPQPPQ